MYVDPDFGARFVFGELGLRLLAAAKIRDQIGNIDAEYNKNQ